MKNFYRLVFTAMLSTALTSFGADPEPPKAQDAPKPKPEEAPKPQPIPQPIPQPPQPAQPAQPPQPSKEPTPAQKELSALVGKINVKLVAGQRAESDFEAELKEFDVLLASHKGEQTDDVAQILMMKLLLYLQAMNDTQKALVLAQQLKKEFPNTAQGKSVDPLIAQIEKIETAKKIQNALVPGVKFPEFAEKDIEGKPLSLAGYKGKVVLVDFWATWCGPCVADLPNVLATYAKHKTNGFDIVGISLDNDEQKLKEFIASQKMSWRQYSDGKGFESALAVKYGIFGIPTTFLLDKNGAIIAKGLRGEEIEKAVAEAVSKN